MKRKILLSAAGLIALAIGLAATARLHAAQHHFAQHFAKSSVAVKGKLEHSISSPNHSGAATAQFFRDSQWRIRIEHDNMIFIVDPPSGLSYVIDTQKQVAHRMALPPEGRLHGPPPPPPPAVAHESGADAAMMLLHHLHQLMSVPRDAKDIGTQTIEGFTTQGKEFTRQLPPRPDGDGAKVTATTQIWFSEELGLPLLVETSNSDGAKQTIRFSQIERASSLDPALFTVPAGYQVVEVRPDHKRD